MSTAPNLNHNFSSVAPPAPVIDILTGAAMLPITSAGGAEAAMVSGATPTGLVLAGSEYEHAAWSLIHDTQSFRENVYELCKRIIDVIGASVLLLALVPLCLIIGVVIKMTSPGPILFRQKRLGQNSRPFCCLKFRTMSPDAEDILAADPALRAAFESTYKIKDDPRVSRFGALLRRTSMDEIPQLWNVLRGEMSLIGPRPIIPPEVAKYGIYGQKLLSVRPGLSGLWQTCGRSDTTYEQRVRFDMLYIDHRSAWLDFKLLLLTVATVFRKAGAC
jgi:lipopolysaccharide/colanic/teichoic acid biosynthesis glycosyltransferase